MEELSGGRESAIYRDGKFVYRPLQPWSSTIHQLLQHFESLKVRESPRFIGTQGEQEILSFVEGETYNYPLSGYIATSESLISAAKLLRKIHDASISLLSKMNVSEQQWMLEPREPYEVICHGDFTPYNVALSKNRVVGVFDFDTAHPAPRVWDLAYSIYCWAPFKTADIDRLGTIEEQISRARLFCDSYGATDIEKYLLVDTMITRLHALTNFMQIEAQKGNQTFIENIEQGHLRAYLHDIEYITSHKHVIQYALSS